MADDRDEEGKFSRQYPDEAFLSAVKSLPVSSTRNVAGKVGCSYNLAYQRLKELEERGEVRSEEVGTSFVWVRT
ncbi:transcriptional regulator [Halorussus ruber]|uniref:transcriptional regulator n=1 Tax=Halorussus ruber TaxID=1126238 RepID=UPI0010919AD1|nr:transcriptional regulator [Halorussus ruber]